METPDQALGCSIEVLFEDTERQYNKLLAVKNGASNLDIDTACRMIHLFKRRAVILELYKDQTEDECLKGIIAKLRDLNTRILLLTSDLI